MSTPRVDFYLLADRGNDSRDRFACRLADKAFQLGHRVYVHTDSAADAARLDNTLWTFRDGSFVPHALASDPGEPVPAVLIGCDDTPPPAFEVLINLAQEVPAAYRQCQRVAEIVTGDADTRAAGRQRFCFYRDHDCTPATHHIDASR